MIEMIRVAGELARASGLPLDENPYDPDVYPDAYDAWAEGWRGDGDEEELV